MQGSERPRNRGTRGPGEWPLRGLPAALAGVRTGFGAGGAGGHGAIDQ
jgi:hypothetical protein